jgi:hypothetical protein
MTTSEARHAGHTLGGDHQRRQHGKLRAERHLDFAGLGDEDADEGGSTTLEMRAEASKI